jgi:tetratricopeptide (TPR) repeat protein
MKRIWIAAGILALLAASIALPCTIISGKTKDGVVWAGNNEDFYFDFNTYLNVLPPEEDLLGAVSFTYGTPDSHIQGGFNEAGLFFDFNALPAIPKSDWIDWGERKEFPGGEMAFFSRMLRTCQTVQNAIDMIKKFKIELAYGQVHLADSKGTLAVVNNSGIRISENNYQVSTNFNIFKRGPSDGGRHCWRYPIAEKMFQEREVSLDTLRDILDATQQHRLVGTIYSNVINLNTGDAYNYYAGDFRNAYHFNLKKLMEQGKKSYLWRSLFPNAPVVKIWETYLSQGAQAAVDMFQKLKNTISDSRQSEVLRHVFSSCLLRENKYADAKIFFDEWLKITNGKDVMTNLYHGLIQLTTGNTEKARYYFTEQTKVNEADELAKKSYRSYSKIFLGLLEENKPPGANAHFELKGLNYVPIINFMKKTKEGWAADFALPPGKHYYAFLVDGEVVFDPANPDKEEIDTEDGKMILNVIVVE